MNAMTALLLRELPRKRWDEDCGRLRGIIVIRIRLSGLQKAG